MSKAILPAGCQAFLDRYTELWNAQDYPALRYLWDPNENEPWWYPEELDAPLVGWPAIEAYWRDCATLIERFGLRTFDARVKSIATDLSMLGFRMKWSAAMRSDPARPIGGEVKVAVLLRHVDPMWQCVHYMEAPLGPLPFVRRAYQSMAEPDLLK